MSRSRRFTLCAVALLAGTVLRSAAAAPVAWSPARVYHEPPWLVVRGQAVTLAYGFVHRGVAVYARSSLQRGFTRLPLVRAPSSGGMWVARVPGRLVVGSKLYYYAVLRDPGTGRELTIPAAGARSPQSVWIVNRLPVVALGRHRFGHVRAPEAIVARAGARDVGFLCCADPPGGDGPSSFDVARDGSGSIWLLDRLNHRLLVWLPGRPDRAARTVRLPRSLSLTDFVLGRDGTIYARDDVALYALTPAGRVRWKVSTPAGIRTAPLQLGPDGAVYSSQACGERCAPFGGKVTWTALTTPGGRPLSPAERRRATSPFEPLPGGLRLVTSELTRWSSSAQDLEPAGEIRFALVDRADRVVRAWSVTSRTKLHLGGAAPALVGGELVVALDVSAQTSKRFLEEDVVLRLGPDGAVQQFSLDARTVLGEVNLFAPLRVGPSGAVYQLRTDRRTGATIARF